MWRLGSFDLSNGLRLMVSGIANSPADEPAPYKEPCRVARAARLAKAQGWMTARATFVLRQAQDEALFLMPSTNGPHPEPVEG
jgi:hypothetical protein